MNELNIELKELENWFKWYDTQAIQYERDLRINNKSNIDIAALDKEAITKAARIKEIKQLKKDIVMKAIEQ